MGTLRQNIPERMQKFDSFCKAYRESKPSDRRRFNFRSYKLTRCSSSPFSLDVEFERKQSPVGLINFISQKGGEEIFIDTKASSPSSREVLDHIYKIANDFEKKKK